MGDSLYHGTPTVLASLPMSAITAFCSRIKPDNFSLALLGTVGFVTVLPCSGHAAEAVGDVTALAIGLSAKGFGAGWGWHRWPCLV